MGKPGHTGLRRILFASKFSMQGFAHAWRHEQAFRQEVLLLLVMVPLALWLGQTLYEKIFLLLSLLLLLIVELLNSAIETAIDRIGLDYHELSGRAKDIGSAAVFLALVVVVVAYASVAWSQFMV